MNFENEGLKNNDLLKNIICFDFVWAGDEITVICSKICKYKQKGCAVRNNCDRLADNLGMKSIKL